MPAGRLPDVLIIGAMKAGSTSLHMWLAEQPETWALPRKEAHFFSQDWVWARGVDWYRGLFCDAPRGSVAFESSTSYSDPDYADAAGARIRAVVPGARLVYVVRHPIDRLRSDYRHTVAEARQDLPLREAVLDPACGHVLRSLYHRCLEPYRGWVAPGQLLVVSFEQLVHPPFTAWHEVLSHLGLPDRPAPGTTHNAAEQKAYSRRVKQLLRRTRLLTLARRLPPSAHRLASKVVATDPAKDSLVASSGDPLPGDVTERIWADAEELQHWLGLDAPLWEPGSASAQRVGDRPRPGR